MTQVDDGMFLDIRWGEASYLWTWVEEWVSDGPIGQSEDKSRLQAFFNRLCPPQDTSPAILPHETHNKILFQEDALESDDNLGTITFGSIMGTDDMVASTKSYPIGPDGKRLKPCCACPETKRARDACVVEKGEESCLELIEAHKACMRNLGFNI